MSPRLRFRLAAMAAPTAFVLSIVAVYHYWSVYLFLAMVALVIMSAGYLACAWEDCEAEWFEIHTTTTDQPSHCKIVDRVG